MSLKTLKRLLQLNYFLALAKLLMELFRSYPWLVLLGSLDFLHWERVPLGLASALVIILVSSGLTRATLARRWNIKQARISTLVVLLLLLLLLVRLEHGAGYAFWDIAWFKVVPSHLPSMLMAVIFGFYLIWRGIVVGREEGAGSNLFSSFLAGIAGFIVLMVAWAALSGHLTEHKSLTTLIPYVVGYFSAGLIALGVNRYQNLRSRMKQDNELLTRRWLIILLVIVLVIILFATIVASSLSLDIINMVVKPLGTLLDWILTAIAYILGYTVGWVGLGLYYIIKFILSRLHLTQDNENQMTDFSDMYEQMKAVKPVDWPPAIFTTVKWIVGVLVIVAVVYLLARALFRYRRVHEDSGVEEINESLWSWEVFTADLLAFFRRFLAFFRRKPNARPPKPVPPAAAVIGDDGRSLDIREIYRGLLWEGHRAKLPKRIGETPFEYQSTLKGTLAEEEESLSILTHAYVQHRYGHIPVKEEGTKALTQLWLRIRAMLRSRVL